MSHLHSRFIPQLALSALLLPAIWACSSGASDGGSASGAGNCAFLPMGCDAISGSDSFSGETCVKIRLLDAHFNKPLPASIAVLFAVDTCKGEPVVGLQQSKQKKDFSLYENNSLISETEASATILPHKYEAFVTLLMDNSPSVKAAGALTKTITAAQGFVDQVMSDSARQVQIRVAVFSKKYSVRQDFTTDKAKVQAALKSLLDDQTGSNTTNLYGALIDAITLSNSAQDTRKDASRGGLATLGQVIVFTDGSDQAALKSKSQAQQAVDNTPDDVVTIAFGGEVDVKVLKELGKSGTTLAKTSDDLLAAFAVAAQRVKALQERIYVLGYCSPKLAGKHKLVIEVKGKGKSKSISFNASDFINDGASCSAEAFEKACANKDCGGLLCGGCGTKATCNTADRCICPNNTKLVLPDCTSCKAPFAGPPSCSKCAEPQKLKGSMCNQCVDPKRAPPDCTTCAPQFAGKDCSVCSAKHDGPNCTLCLDKNKAWPDCEKCTELQFTGPKCDQCAMAGVSPPDCLPPGMVAIPGGDFWMGCSKSAPGGASCSSNAKPRHKVTLSPYFIDTTEVTVEAYKKCVDAKACTTLPSSKSYKSSSSTYKRYNWNAPGRTKHPINGVTFSQATAYCKYVGGRLPTEAEWEKAARGGCHGGALEAIPGDPNTAGCTEATSPFPWGKVSPSCTYAVLQSGSSSTYNGCKTGYTMAVSSKAPGKSPYGAHDMIGNITEYTADKYSSSYYASSPKLDPKATSGSTYVGRGGSFSSRYNEVANHYRLSVSATSSNYYSGFRCARSAQ